MLVATVLVVTSILLTIIAVVVIAVVIAVVVVLVGLFSNEDANHFALALFDVCIRPLSKHAVDVVRVPRRLEQDLDLKAARHQLLASSVGQQANN